MDRVADLLQPLQEKHLAEIEVDPPARFDVAALESAFPEVRFESPQPGTVRVESDERLAVGRIVRFLEESGMDVAEARRLRPSLEEVFVQVTGIAASAMQGERQGKGARR